VLVGPFVGGIRRSKTPSVVVFLTPNFAVARGLSAALADPDRAAYAYIEPIGAQVPIGDVTVLDANLIAAVAASRDSRVKRNEFVARSADEEHERVDTIEKSVKRLIDNGLLLEGENDELVYPKFTGDADATLAEPRGEMQPV
jgi:hypothetical protein